MRRLRSTHQGPAALAVQRDSLSALLCEGLVLGDSHGGEPGGLKPLSAPGASACHLIEALSKRRGLRAGGIVLPFCPMVSGDAVPAKRDRRRQRAGSGSR